jgi:hypothetical protein
MESVYLVSLGTQRFSSVTSVIRFLDSLPLDKRYQAQKLVADQLSVRRHVVGEELVSFLDYVVGDQAWSSEVTLDQFTAEWQPFQEIAHQVKRERNKLMEVKRTIEARWGPSSSSLMIDRSYHFLSPLRKLARQYSMEDAMKQITRAIAHRVMHSKSRRKFIIDIIAMPEMLMATSPGTAYQNWDLRLMQNKSAMNTRMEKYDILINNLSKMLSSVNNLYMNLSFQWCFNALCLVNCRSVSSQDDSSTRSHFVN